LAGNEYTNLNDRNPQHLVKLLCLLFSCACDSRNANLAHRTDETDDTKVTKSILREQRMLTCWIQTKPFFSSWLCHDWASP